MIRKALIPISGKATRLMPVSSVVPKAMFPLVDRHGCLHTVLHIILKEAAFAGIECVGVVISPWQRETLHQYFDAVSSEEASELPSHTEYIAQSSPKGFGDAVLKGADFVGNEPFILMLGDHVYIEDPNKLPCVVQIAKAFDSVGGVAMIGMQLVSAYELPRVGVAAGIPIQQDIYQCTDFVEKPDLLTARQRLVTAGLPKDIFLAHCGIYIFGPEIFDCLSEVSSKTRDADGEIELADAQAVLLKKYPEEYFLYKIAGRAYDTGTPIGYATAQSAFHEQQKPTITH